MNSPGGRPRPEEHAAGVRLEGRPQSAIAPQFRPMAARPLAKSSGHSYIALARLRRASGTNISPGPYRSLRELSLARSVDLDIWCPPTFVGNSGIERFNGDCGFALLSVSPYPSASLFKSSPVDVRLLACRVPATFEAPRPAGRQRR
ncbi:hypothetical protein BRAD285_0662 [Bradyrhizobium sp. ORS 285]|nr:hypothetical protein BRAO285_560013 [Bradyrhizobium sp. ORS 285]SMX55949.1 hypothetical protein BRAD285_0662 [Bradyrhizobium sp. ORS 285]